MMWGGDKNLEVSIPSSRDIAKTKFQKEIFFYVTTFSLVLQPKELIIPAQYLYLVHDAYHYSIHRPTY